MKIFQRLESKEVEKREYNPQWIQTLTSAIMGAAKAGTSTTSVSEQQSLTVSAVYSAVSLLSELTASLDLNYEEDDGSGYYKKVKTGKIARCLRKPNDYQTRYSFVQSMKARALLRGNSYAFKLENQDNIKLIPIIGDKTVDVLLSPDGTEVFYRVNGQSFSADEFIHFKGLSLDGIMGLSPIHYAARTLANAVDSERYMNKVFESGIQASGFFQTAEKLTDKVYERLKNDIKDKSGIDRAGEAQILEQGLTFERNTLTAQDAAIADIMSLTVSDIARIFRVPKNLLYEDTGVKSSSVMNSIEFLTYSLNSSLVNIEQELDYKLLMPSAYDSQTKRIKFDVSNLLRTEPDKRVKYYKDLFDIGGITSNEVRAREGMPSIDGGDDAFVQLNLAPLSMIGDIIQEKINKQIDSTNG